VVGAAAAGCGTGAMTVAGSDAAGATGSTGGSGAGAPDGAGASVAAGAGGAMRSTSGNPLPLPAAMSASGWVTEPVAGGASTASRSATSMRCVSGPVPEGQSNASAASNTSATPAIQAHAGTAARRGEATG